MIKRTGSSQTMRMKAICILIALVLSTNVRAAGPRIHAEMGKRAYERYFGQADAMLPGLRDLFSTKEAKRAYFSGCMFPDWGYNGINHDAGEDSHWHPFHAAYFDHLRETYRPPWDKPTQCRIAFFLGIIVHGVTDIPWHFDRGNDKSINTRVNAHDGRSAGQGYEVATDVFGHADFRISEDLSKNAYWPKDDIMAAYARRRNSSVTDADLERGFKLSESGWAAGKASARYGGRLPYTLYKSKFPWCQSGYENYYYGGVEHGAALCSMWVKYYYARLNGWHYYQNMPLYGVSADSYRPYRGCQEGHICKAAPDANTGAEPLFALTGDGPNDPRRGLIRFDVSDIPPGTQIGSAKLWLYFAGRRGGRQSADKIIELYKVNRSWQAGNGRSDEVSGFAGRHAKIGQATWRSASHLESQWQAQGCEAVPGDRDPEPAAILRVSPSEAPGSWKSWDVTRLVRFWVNKPERNHGMLLKENAQSLKGGGVLQFFSSEAFKCQPDGMGGGKRVAYRPLLIVMPR